VVERILEKELLAQANPTRGRFRTFLLNALDNFVISQRRKAQAQKRAPSGDVLSVDELSPADEPQHNDPPIDRTEIVWAQPGREGVPTLQAMGFPPNCIRALSCS